MATKKQLGGAAAAGSVWCHWGVTRPAASARSAGSYFLGTARGGAGPGVNAEENPCQVRMHATGMHHAAER